MKTAEALTPEKLQEIYTDEKFRNEVAFAHGYCKANGERIGSKTCTYPVEYIVTEEQIAEAEAERKRAKKAKLGSIEGKLVFVGMGMTYESRYDGDVCNHRVRANIQNPKGEKFFLEVGSGQGERMRIDHSIKIGELDQNNYQGLERMAHDKPIPYKLAHILRLVNIHFECHFTEIEIDNYNLQTEEYINISPWKAQEVAKV